MSSDLPALLTVWYDQVEAEARKNQRRFIDGANGVTVRQGDWARVICDPIIGPFGGQTRTRDVATGMYVAAMSDPDRVLADIALKRAILARHCGYRIEGRNADGDERSGDFCAECALEEYPCATVRQLGTEVSANPGYDPAWKP